MFSNCNDFPVVSTLKKSGRALWPAIRKKIPMFVMVPNLIMVTNFGIVLAFVIIPDLAMNSFGVRNYSGSRNGFEC